MKKLGYKMQDSWDLKHTNNLNQLLRIKKEITQNKNDFTSLLIVKHRYHASDDIMFPDPACLAFFTAFEENHLKKFEDEKSMVLVAVDIFEGLMQFFIYCKDAKKSVYDCIEFLKSNSNFEVEFEIKEDSSWSNYNKLID